MTSDGETTKKKPKLRPGDTPPAVKEGIIKDLAAMPKGKQGGRNAIASKWGVTYGVVVHLSHREKMEIMGLREQLAQSGFMIAAHLDQHMVATMADPEAMKKVPLKDLAKARENYVDSSVTALDGHQSVFAPVNFQFLKETARDVDRFDEIMREKRAKARVIEPKGLPMA